jgi:hypothetical protein
MKQQERDIASMRALREAEWKAQQGAEKIRQEATISKMVESRILVKIRI